MEYSVRHRTTYRYAQDVSYSRHLMHLAPRDTATQKVANFELIVSPVSAVRVRGKDYFGNSTDRLALYEPHAVVDIVAVSRVTAIAPPERDPEASAPWEEMRAYLETMHVDTQIGRAHV